MNDGRCPTPVLDGDGTPPCAVSRADIPEGREARIEWLYAWWERVDAWIEENRVEPVE